MQRAMERGILSSPLPEDPVMLLRQKHTVLKVRDAGDVTPQRRPNLQWRAQQLLRLAEELQAEWQEAQQAEWQEAQLLQDLEQLCSSHVLGAAAAGWAEENKAEAEGSPEEPAPQGPQRTPRAKEKHKVILREHKSHKEERPRQHARRPKLRRKAPCPERQGATKTRGLGPTKKSKRKRVPLSKTSGGRQPVDLRVGRGMSPLLITAEELKCLQEKQRAREGRRKAGKGATVRFARGPKNNPEDQRSKDRMEELQQLWPVSSGRKSEARAPASPNKCITKNKWQRELESAFEQLFNTNRKLKRHLNLHLDSRPRKDQHPQARVLSALQGCSSDTSQERAAKVQTLPAGECGDPAEAEVPQMTSKTDLKQSLSKAELPKCHQVAQLAVKDESQTSLPEEDPLIDEDDLLSKSTECEHETPELGALVESSPEPHPQVQEPGADWMALGQRPRLELEWRRQKPSFEHLELPDLSLEIHYSAEREEERKAQRKVRLALMKSYPNRYQTKERGSPFRLAASSSGSSIIEDDEERQNQMIRDIQQQISEQNKLHEQFLEKARKRLLEFQSIC